MYKFIIIASLISFSCETPINDIKLIDTTPLTLAVPTLDLNTIHSRFKTPDNYTRATLDSNSFGYYLSHLKLKPKGSLVKYYNGNEKINHSVYEAVVDLEIGTKDLHQCADAIMRLRAEYLWNNKKYDQIHFNFTNGFKVNYSEWMKGRRMIVKGSKTYWNNRNAPSNTYKDFWNYMELIFMYAGTASLEKELNSVDINEAKIGDILIQGGHPGHAIIIVDKATDKTTGKSVFILAQSYMPAQELQILTNPNNSSKSPWYEFDSDKISTPEWLFYNEDLKRF